MPSSHIAYIALLLAIWAGVSLGGSLVAAPAKFQAPSLELSTALEVGRAQFMWLGITEFVLCAAVVLLLFLSPGPHSKWVMAPIAFFACQRLLVMPTLDARTLEVIGGAPAGQSYLHLVFIIFEVLKFILLIASAIFLIPMIRGAK